MARITHHKQTILIKTNEKNPEPLEVVADHIIQISEAMKRFRNGRVKDRVLLLLLRDSTNVNISDIERVINGIDKLKEAFIKKAT